MKVQKVKYYACLDQVTSQEVTSYLSKLDGFEEIDAVNWPDSYPLKPKSKFKIARSSSAFFIHFVVNEKQIKAIYSNDQDPVWQDSCVEFFCQIPGSKTYFNFEFNCIGTCLATERKSRTEDVNPLSPEKMSQIKRYASLGNEPFEEKKGNFNWTLTVEIPFSLLGIDPDNLPASIKANFYKCGDETSVPHYVSWSPIEVENPDFHRPEFFGELVL
ncbi:MAG: carbohydrate-binding family 9-like protein [Paludibacter sp.]|nr:carbohydrate-binding family 9-like protein [Paludibacter sp.]